MADARREHDWSIASSLMAMLAEIHRDRKRRARPFRAEEFNPLSANRSKAIPTTVSQLAQMMRQPATPSKPSPCHKSKQEPPTSN